MKITSGETMHTFRNMVAINSFSIKLLDLISKENEYNETRGFDIENFKVIGGQNDTFVFNLRIKEYHYEALWVGVIVKIQPTVNEESSPNCIWDAVGFSRSIFNPTANLQSNDNNQNKFIKFCGTASMNKLATILIADIAKQYINYLKMNSNDLIEDTAQNQKEIEILETRIQNAKTEIRNQNENWKKETEEYEGFLGQAARLEEMVKTETAKAKAKFDMMQFYKARIAELKSYVRECENKIRLRTPDCELPKERLKEGNDIIDGPITDIDYRDVKKVAKDEITEELRRKSFDPGILTEEEIEALKAPLE